MTHSQSNSLPKPSSNEFSLPIADDDPTKLSLPEFAIDGSALLAGRYDLGDRIARGGMGTVYKARDRLLNRTVAVKLLRRRYLDRVDLLRRFMDEAQISARLQHPGIAPIYDVGTLPDGRPFIAMKLIEGMTLSRLLRERTSIRDDIGQYLKFFESLCLTVSYAHTQEIIHRDLKPDNIMVGPFGEVLVMDWGLAKDLDTTYDPPLSKWEVPLDPSSFLSHDGSLSTDEPAHPTSIVALPMPSSPIGDLPRDSTHAGEVFGTMPFMPPEQARGETDKIDKRCDVFALGGILCQIVTGEPPYTGTSEAIREQARSGNLFGAYSRLDRCGADPQLVLLVKNCLAMNPDDRPADAGGIAEMIDEYLRNLQHRTRHLEMQMYSAIPPFPAPIPVEETAHLKRRTRRLSTALAVCAVLIAGLLTIGLGQLQRKHSDLYAADRERQRLSDNAISTALDEADTANGDLEGRLASGSTDTEMPAAQARSAFVRAESLVRIFANPPEELRTRLESARTRTETNERHAKLCEAIEGWNLKLLTSNANAFDFAEASRECSTFLRSNGFDPFARSTENAAKELNAHPRKNRVRDVLINWMTLSPDDAERSRILEILTAAGEPEPSARCLALIAKRLWPQAVVAATHDAMKLPTATLIAISRQSGDSGQVNVLLKRAVVHQPTDFLLNAELGTRLAATPERREDAMRHLVTAVAARPEHSPTQILLGRVLCDLNRTDDAIAVLKAAVVKNPRSSEAQYQLGELLTKTQMSAAAMTCFEAAVAAEPGHLAAQTRIIDAAMKRNDFPRAETACRTVLAFLAEGEAADSARMTLGKILASKNDFEQAIPLLQRALEKRTDDLDLRMRLAESCEKSGDTEAARRHYRTAANQDPKADLPRRKLAELLLAGGDVKGALSEANFAAALEPKRVANRRLLGDLLERQGDLANAIVEYQAVAGLEPADAANRERLANTCLKKGDLAAAEGQFRELLKLKPDHALAKFNIGQFLVQRNDESAIGFLKSALMATPDSIDIKEAYCQALAKFGRFRDASTLFKEIAASLPENDARKEALTTQARKAQRASAMESRIPDLLAGGIGNISDASKLELIDICRKTKRFATASRLYAELPSQSTLPVEAIHCAIAAALGQGADPVPPEQRSAFHRSARQWIAARPGFDSRNDPLLASVRQAEELAKLPEPEGDAWRSFWRERGE